MIILRIFQKLYSTFIGTSRPPILSRESDPDTASEMIYNLLSSDKPCMIARFGSTELAALVNYKGVNTLCHSSWKYISGRQPEWWWNRNIMEQMQKWSGFFPSTPENLQRFGDLMMRDIQELDLLGCWTWQEGWFIRELHHVQKVHLRLLEPFWANLPWSRYLANKRVVVVHPFASEIENQYRNYREKLFTNPDVLPEFKSFRIVKAVQSLGGNCNEFSNWFEALDWMKQEIDHEDYDVALIGCGAYGFPLAAHVKRQGKKAIHLGGSLQLLFGIKGRRWEDPNYGVREWGIPYGSYSSLMNEYWVHPSDENKPKDVKNVEGACYW